MEVGSTMTCGEVSQITRILPSASCAAAVSGLSVDLIFGKGLSQP